MTTNMSGSRRSYVYVGLAGETAPGREVGSGLYRMADGGEDWESLTNGLPDSPAVRTIVVHPERPQIVYVGTQSGPYRSTDHGDHWEKVSVPDHGLPVWSLLFDPGDADVIYAGYESCEIYRSEDAGETWRRLPVSVRFPEVTMTAGANKARRILMMAASTADSNELYGAVEVGGLIRSLDGGDHWDNLSHGLYLNDDQVDMHGVLASSLNPGTVISISRAGMFRSTDRGDHWQHVDLEPLNDKGQTYCRSIREVPGDPRSIWLAAGLNFRSESGVLFRSCDVGVTWERVDIGFETHSTMFGIAFSEREPIHMYCTTKQRRGVRQPGRRHCLDRPSDARGRHAGIRSGMRLITVPADLVPESPTPQFGTGLPIERYDNIASGRLAQPNCQPPDGSQLRHTPSKGGS